MRTFEKASGAERRQRILAFMRAFIHENGQSPSVAEIARQCHIGPNTAKYHLRLLQQRGQVRYRMRVWSLVEPGATPVQAAAMSRLSEPGQPRGVPGQ